MDERTRGLRDDEFGALKFSSLDQLYQPQKEAATFILRNIHEFAAEAFLARIRRSRLGRDVALDAPMGSDPRDFERPHHVFMIDGERGSGKTTVLLTLQGHLSLMRLSPSRITSPDDDETSLIADLVRLELKAPSGATGHEKVALVLPVVFTEEMEPHEATMEAVFALLEGQIAEAARREADQTRRKRLGDLIATLRSQVSVSWTFARQIGAEAVADDALDYKDYVDKRADYNRHAYTRVPTWRRFIDRCLDELGYEVLVLLFDDSDLNPVAGEDIIRAIRMYFSHPRVVSVMACESTNLQLTIFSRNIASHLPGLQGLTLIDEVYAARLGQSEDENSAALLEKIFPPAYRRRLKTSDMEHIKHFFPASDNDRDPFAAWCRTRYIAAIGRADDTNRQQALIWWLLSGPYRRMIADNIRRIVNFRYRTRDLGSEPLDILLDNHLIRELVSTVGRDINTLREQIERGEYDPEWIDDDQRPDLSGPELMFVDFWVDAQIGSSFLNARDMVVVQRWLPSHLGSSADSTQITDRHRSLGVASVFDSHILPRNCLYIFQFRHLSRVAMEELPGPSPWIAWLQAWDAYTDVQAVADEAEALVGLLDNEDPKSTLEILSIQVGRAKGSTRQISDSVAIRSAVALFAISRPEVEGPAELIQEVSKLSALENLSDFAAFANRLKRALTTAERQRQEALFSWSCAIALAELGDDNVRLERSPSIRQLAVPLQATQDQNRLRSLSLLTLERLKFIRRQTGSHCGSRHSLLLVWSLIPLLRPIHDFGTDNRLDPNVPESWERLKGAIEEVAADFQPFVSAGEDEARELSDLSWLFPDMTSDDLAAIINEVVKFAATFGAAFRAARAAGSPPPRTQWSRRPDERLAFLLGTSIAWARGQLGN